jgi:hypothetical protein
MWTYPDVIPSLIENTTMQMGINESGAHKTYRITPVPGYVIHDNTRDYTDLDPETMEEVEKLGFTRGTVSCAANYDFAANPRDFYAVPETDVPADQIFGGGNDHEVM